MTWTKKHDKFALACNLSESQQLMLRDALRKCRNEPIEIEYDLRNTNKWIGKVRLKGEYHRKTMVTGAEALDEKSMGMFTILKKYSPWVYRVMIRPLEFVERIQRAKCESTPKPTTLNPMFDAEHKKNAYKQQQQNISRLDSLFRKIGMKYTPDALARIWGMAHRDYDNVVDAVQLLLHRHSTQSKPIPNPYGWLVDCLKFGWHHDSELVQKPELPVYDSIMALVEGCNRLRSLPVPAT